MSKILAIDDRKDNLISLSAVLKYKIPGCTVLTAQSGEEGISITNRERPDTILLDIKMPGMDGYEVCKRIKKNESTGHIPIIMLTANRTESEDISKGLDSGADAFLSKPIDDIVLVAQVNTALRIKYAEDRLRREKAFLDEQVQKRTAELMQITRSLEEAQRIANVGSWERDLQTNELWWSDELYRISGREQTEGTPSIESWHRHIHTDDIKYYDKAIKQSLTTGKYNVDYRLIRFDDNEIRQVHSEGEVSYDDRGTPIKLFGVIKDVTKEKKLELQLRQAQKMESIGTLAGGIAHDFNNILTSIIGFTDLSLGEIPKDTTIEGYLQEVYSAGKRARDLVKQILTFARQSDEKKSPVQPNLVLKEALKLLRSSIPTTIEIKQNIKSESMIMGNATQIHQVIMNLGTNAAQAMEDEGGVLEVSLKDSVVEAGDASRLIGLRPGNYIELAVSDTGIGISPESIQSIFEPYFTTKNPGEGTGMGLAMVHGIVESYGGKIDVDSQPGRGSTFTIYLPRIKKQKRQRPYEAETMPSGTERILFIDDEVPIVKMGKNIFERLGYSITTRISSIEALELFREDPNRFDLVITDMTMPEMTGDELATELMMIRPDIPVILFTGYSKKISDVSSEKIGIKAFVYKPIVIADLARTVRKVLDEAKPKKKKIS